jgi:hypothetical protein
METVLIASGNIRDFYIHGAAKLCFSVVQHEDELAYKMKVKHVNYTEITLARRVRPKNIFGCLRLTIHANRAFFSTLKTADCVLVDSRELYYMYRRCLPEQKDMYYIPYLFGKDEELKSIVPPAGKLLKSKTMATALKLAEKTSSRPWSFILQALRYEPVKQKMREMELANSEVDSESHCRKRAKIAVESSESGDEDLESDSTLIDEWGNVCALYDDSDVFAPPSSDEDEESNGERGGKTNSQVISSGPCC